MKKFVVYLMVGAMLMATGCTNGPESTPGNPESTPRDSRTTPAELESESSNQDWTPGDDNVQYIRTHSDYGRDPIVSVISSKEELEEYYELHKDVNRNPAFENVPGTYSDDFFADSFLAIIRLEEGSGSIRHKVEKISGNGDIAVSRLIPAIGTCDMATWHIIIELKHTDFSSDMPFKVQLSDIRYSWDDI